MTRHAVRNRNELNARLARYREQDALLQSRQTKETTDARAS